MSDDVKMGKSDVHEGSVMDRAELERRECYPATAGTAYCIHPVAGHTTWQNAAELEEWRDAAVLAAKREAYEECAKIVDGLGHGPGGDGRGGWDDACADAAARIRARAAALEAKP